MNRGSFYNLMIILTGVLLWTTGFESVALADDSRHPVVTEVQVIYASKQGHEVDPKIGDVQKRLADLFDFSTYRLLGNHHQNGHYGKAVSVDLPGERRLTLKPLGKDDDRRIRLHAEIADLINTELRLKDGGMMILGGPRYDKGVLILVITVTEKS